ncbi:MAG: hypothetical protein NVSMB62_11400 [Acidobacteriaceae bacterium]
MTSSTQIGCAIYTRKSSEEGLEQSFNSLQAQREACEAYILSQRHEGWEVIKDLYDDGGFSGGNMTRPALTRLLEDIARKVVDTVVVYKVDRLTRSLTDFARIVDQFDKQGVSFVSVTQQFNTTTSMGRLTLNVLLSFAQFEREVTGERIRDKVAASKRKGMWMGGVLPIGYDLRDRQVIVNPGEAEQVQQIYRKYLELQCVSKLRKHLEDTGVRSKLRTSTTGRISGGAIYSRGALYGLLQSRFYRGEITHKGASYPGQHQAIIDQELWERVQMQFKANMQAPRRRARTSSNSLLTGLLYDAQGNRFTPSHAIKKSKRYRYYVSEAVISKPSRKSEGPTRLPAEEIEQAVIAQIQGFLQSPQRMQDALCGADSSPEEIQRAAEVAQKWATATADDVRGLLPSLLQRVVLQKDAVELHLQTRAIREGLDSADTRAREGVRTDSPDGLTVASAPAAFMKCKGEVRLVLSPDAGLSRQPVPSLVKAVARAHQWLDTILRGELPNQSAIAQQSGVHKRYVGRVMQLAFLAPDMTEAILEGSQPPHLSLEAFRTDIPADWAQQRNLLEHHGAP